MHRFDDSVASPCTDAFVVAVRLRRLNHRERQLGEHRYPYRKDLEYHCAVCPTSSYFPDGFVSLFDPDSTSTLKMPSETVAPPRRHSGTTADATPSSSGGGGGRLQDSERRYSFHHVFGEATTNEDVYRTAVQPLVAATREGYNATCFAYGMTSSGKSYTMVGSPPLRAGDGDRSVLGVCHYALRDIFSWDHDKAEREGKTTVHATFVELYNEKLRDLLVAHDGSAAHPSTLLEPEIVEDAKKGTMLHHVVETPVSSLAHLEVLLEQGTLRRSKATTASNDCSSRSHAILQLTIRRSMKDPSESSSTPHPASNKVLCSRLCLVDLAGSERATIVTLGQHGALRDTSTTFGCGGGGGVISDAKADRRREGANINRSLLALGNCITALAASARTTGSSLHGTPSSSSSSLVPAFVPYRDSKLTRLLKDSLGGNTKTLMIATISPSCLCYEETLSTLQYATRAKAIHRTVFQNVDRVSTTPHAVSSSSSSLRDAVPDNLPAGIPSVVNRYSIPPPLTAKTTTSIDAADRALLPSSAAFTNHRQTFQDPMLMDPPSASSGAAADERQKLKDLEAEIAALRARQAVNALATQHILGKGGNNKQQQQQQQQEETRHERSDYVFPRPTVPSGTRRDIPAASKDSVVDDGSHHRSPLTQELWEPEGKKTCKAPSTATRFVEEKPRISAYTGIPVSLRDNCKGTETKQRKFETVSTRNEDITTTTVGGLQNELASASSTIFRSSSLQNVGPSTTRHSANYVVSKQNQTDAAPPGKRTPLKDLIMRHYQFERSSKDVAEADVYLRRLSSSTTAQY